MDWEDDYGDDTEVDMSPCPLCGEPIYNESECCPHCGEYIVQSTSFMAERPLWFRALWLIVVTFLIYQLIVWF